MTSTSGGKLASASRPVTGVLLSIGKNNFQSSISFCDDASDALNVAPVQVPLNP